MSFNKTFTKLCYSREPSIVFEDFLDFVIDQFLINPNIKYFNHSKYSEKEYNYFFDLFKALVEKLDSELKKGKKWFDVLGYFYEASVKSRMKASNMGQFFTPVHICDMMAELNLSNISSDEVLGVTDCCCGSSRMLLAHHSKRPFDLCFGMDLDITSCKMSIINFILHGVKGSINHMNTLSGEWFNGWKVNEFIDMGCPFTVMACENLDQTTIFIGEKTGKKVEVPKQEEITPVIKKTGQMTLI